MGKKCQQCGLVNWEDDQFCKRCGASLKVTTPPVYKWFVAYCIVMALLYFGLVITGIMFLFVEPDPEMSETEAAFMSVVFIVIGLVFVVPHAAAPFLPRTSWVWVFGLVLICFGLSSACCLPACIPLLIQWLKPEVKEFYGRVPNPLPPPPPQWN